MKLVIKANNGLPSWPVSVMMSLLLEAPSQQTQTFLGWLNPGQPMSSLSQAPWQGLELYAHGL